jgi:fimbrial chaperone protein
MPRAPLLPLLFCALVLQTSAAWAASVSVKPVRVELSAAKRSELVEIRNSGKTAARFQAEAHAWYENTDGQMTLVPTRDLLFFPSLFEIQPGETRRIRVSSAVRPGPVERSYRLIVNQFPERARPGTVQVLTRLSIPIFVQTPDPKPQPTLKLGIEPGRLVVVLANTGSSYFKAQAVRVVARSSSGEPLLEQTLAGWYVLVGGQRRYSLELPPGACVALATVSATARTDAGETHAESQPRAGAACGG